MEHSYLTPGDERGGPRHTGHTWLHIVALAGAVCGCGPETTLAPAHPDALPSAASPAPSPHVQSHPPPPLASVSPPASAAPKAPSPMPGDLPRELRAALSAHATCAAHKTCALSGLYPEGVGDVGNAPAAIWSHELEGKGTSVTFVRAAAIDLYGVMITGAGEVKGTEPGAQAIALRPWMAFRAAGGGVVLSASEPLTRLVLAGVTGGEPIRQAAEELSSKKAAAGWQKRSEPIRAIDLAAQPDLSWAGGAMHARIGFEGEKVRASFGVLMASKDAAVAQHDHASSWEILVMLQGQGTLKIGTDPASTDLKAVALSDGSVTAVPKATQHAWLPGDARSLIAIQLYVPAGPEQRFKALASATPVRANP